MIVNANNFDPLQILLSSAFQFFLTGSRYFGDKTPNDHDFFVEDSRELRRFLEEHRFEYLGIQYADESRLDYVLDENLRGVYRKIHNGVQYDVQIVRSAKVKNTAQEMICKDSNLRKVYNLLEKKDRTYFWNAIYKIVEMKT